VAIDKLDKIGLEAVNAELAERGFSQEAVADLQPILFLEGGNREKISALRDHLMGSEQGIKGLDELEEVFDLLDTAGISQEHLAFDITLARGLSYYTGAIFEVKVSPSAIGSISGGGRYDDLTGVFGLKGVSGVGFSFGVDRLYDVLEEQQLFPADSLQSTQVLFINFDADSQRYCLPLLQRLRGAGVKAELYPHAAKLAKQLTYANNKQIPYAVMAGSREIEAGQVALKEMATGEQRQLDAEGLLAFFGGKA
jgi:histidyl-tRNA synthetase